MTDNSAVLGLFEATGVEVELMIVRADDLSALPVADRVLFAAAGEQVGDVERAETAWSNELVLHVIELKTNGPRQNLAGLAAALHRDVLEIESLLEPLGGQLLPSAMHPLFEPARETRLWPHEYGEIYAAYDRHFGARTHGFANVQSVHINLPFCSDEEFGRLHAAIRLVLPLLPALAASSPVVEGRLTQALDSRLLHYGSNQARFSSISGLIIPERAFTRESYQREILDVIAKDLASIDPEGLFEPEWVNSRGAIARFSRGSIEIRLLDTQECPTADVALVAATVALVQALCAERWTSSVEQRTLPEAALAHTLREAILRGGAAQIEDPAYLRCFGLGPGRKSLQDVWCHVIDELSPDVDGCRGALDVILREGTLAERLLRSIAGDCRPEHLERVFRELGVSLRKDTQFCP